MSASGGDQRKRLFLLLLSVAIFAPLLAIGVTEARVGQVLERRIYDQWFALRGPLPISEEVVVVSIDLDAEAALGRWPWSRERHAQLLRNLDRAGAKVVAFDVTFFDPFPAEDSIFRAAIDETGIAILGAYHDPRSTGQATVVGLEAPRGELTGVPIGLVGILPDGADAVVREYPMGGNFLQGRILQLGVHSALRYMDLPPEALVETAEGWRLGDREIPRGPAGGMLINFRGGKGHVQSYSYLDILDDGEVDLGGWEMGLFLDHLAAGSLEGKIVLVGSTIVEHQDYHPTPFREGAGVEVTEQIPGVEIHASAVATLLAGDWIRFIPRPFQYAWIFLIGLLTVLAAGRVRGIMGAGLTLLLIAGAAGAAYALFIFQGAWLWAVAPALSSGVAYAGTTMALYVLEEAEKARIRGMFQQYVAESVVDELIRNPALLQLGGEERVLSVLFSDVAGFSGVSEVLTPTQLVELLNEYLTAMSDIVMEEGGIIDKYQGDALMAEFGAPVPMADHAVKACQAALRMDRELARLREKWEAEGKPLLEARIGINTGQMLLGNLGSRRIMDYTVMGDQVNLASRLEGTNKLYGTTIMVSEFTWTDVKGEMLGRELDRIRVKGKEEPVTIHEILGARRETSAEAAEGMNRLTEHFEAALGLYRDRRFEAALAAFEAILAEWPGDGPSELYIGRCREFISDPPPEGWDGVYTMTTK